MVCWTQALFKTNCQKTSSEDKALTSKYLDTNCPTHIKNTNSQWKYPLGQKARHHTMTQSRKSVWRNVHGSREFQPGIHFLKKISVTLGIRKPVVHFPKLLEQTKQANGKFKCGMWFTRCTESRSAPSQQNVIPVCTNKDLITPQWIYEQHQHSTENQPCLRLLNPLIHKTAVQPLILPTP